MSKRGIEGNVIRAVILATVLNVVFIFGSLYPPTWIDQKNKKNTYSKGSVSQPKEGHIEAGWVWLAAHSNEISTILIAIFNGLLVYVTFRLVSSTEKLWESGERQMGVVKDFNQASQRAWIIVEHEIVEPLLWEISDDTNIESDRAAIVLSIKFKNIGKSPAVNFYPTCKLLMLPLGVSNMDEWNDMIINNDKHQYFGDIIFPDQKNTIRWKFDITGHMFKRLNQDFTNNPFINPWILICASYQLPGDDQMRHTAVRLQVSKSELALRWRQDVLRTELTVTRPYWNCIRAN